MAKVLPREAVFRGVCLTAPQDKIPEGKLPYALNVAQDQIGAIKARAGLSAITASAITANRIHTILRLNNETDGTFKRILGIGTEVRTGTTSFSSAQSTGHSGSRLSPVCARPPKSPTPYAYLADSSKLIKIGVDGNASTWGIAGPTSAPTATISKLSTQILENFETHPNSWAAGGEASSHAAGSRVSTTIEYVLFDTGSTGWATVSTVGALSDNIQPGGLLVVNSEGDVVVEDVFPEQASTTIEQIRYDSGSTGLCWITLTAPSYNLKVNQILRNSTLSENVRVQAVVTGPGGLPSIRVSTTNTWAATNSVQGIRSFRAHFTNTKSAGQTITSATHSFTVTHSSTGIGYIQKTVSLNLSTVNNRPVGPEDEIHLAVKIDSPQNVVEGKILFDVDATTNDFTKNYLAFGFEKSLLELAAQNSQSLYDARQAIIQRGVVDDYAIRNNPNQYGYGGYQGPYSGDYYDDYYQQQQQQYYSDPSNYAPQTLPTVSQTAPGSNIWTELRFKVKDLVPFGSDASRTLRDVKAVRILFRISSGTSINAEVDSLWIGGTYGPDSSQGSGGYEYCYRYGNRATGDRSPLSPPTRFKVLPRRESVALTGTQSADSQVDLVEWFRRGGTIGEYVLVGESSNSSTPSFTDIYSDSEISPHPRADYALYQPFPTIDSPKTMTCNVFGTKLIRTSGDTFNTSWARNTIIIVNGVACTAYTSPSSTFECELNESVGYLAGVTVSVPEPVLLAQPLPNIFGPYTYADSGATFIFACGDKKLPGTLHWTIGNNPSFGADANKLEITGHNEPLIAGGMYDQKPFVCSDQRMFFIHPTGDPLNPFFAVPVANSKGIISRTALTVGKLIYFVSDDGVYASEGGQPRSITHEDLYPLFPHDGIPGRAVNGINPPDYSQPDEMQLEEIDGELWFTYKDSSANRWTLVLTPSIRGWIPRRYTPGIATFYEEEGKGITTVLAGGDTGKLYSLGGTTDDGTAISSEIQTPQESLGAVNVLKIWEQVSLDLIGGPVAVTPRFDFDNTVAASQNATSASRGVVFLDLNSGDGTEAKTLSLKLTWTDQTTQIFSWRFHYRLEHLWEPTGDTSRTRKEQSTSFGLRDYFHVQKIQLAHQSTGDLTLTLTLDSGTQTFTITNSGGSRSKSMIYLAPNKTKLLAVKLTDSTGARVNRKDSEVWVKPWGSPEGYQVLGLFNLEDFSDEGGG